MTVKKFLYVLLAAALLLIVPACGRFANYYDKAYVPLERVLYEQVRPHNITRMRGVTRHRPVTRTGTPQSARRGGTNRPPTEIPPTRVVPHSTQRPHGQVVEIPGTYSRQDAPVHQGTYSAPAPQSIQPIPPEPTPANTQRNTQESPATPAPAKTPAPSKPAHTPAANATSESTITRNSATAGRELASHKTEFNAKEEARKTNITRASSSINGHVVQPGETFSYNQTVGPTIERRGYEESTIYVQGEKKKGFGGGVCQVSTTLSIAAEDAGMTIVERHDHSLPVTYAEEGDEAATSYGGIDFKFKNEKPFPVVIRSSVEGGTISVSICEG